MGPRRWDWPVPQPDRGRGAENPALCWREGLPTFKTQQRGIRAQHRAIGQAKTARAVEQLEREAAGAQHKAKQNQEGAVAGAGFTAGEGHVDQVAAGIELMHGIGVSAANGVELLRVQLQIAGVEQTTWCRSRREPAKVFVVCRPTDLTRDRLHRS